MPWFRRVLIFFFCVTSWKQIPHLSMLSLGWGFETPGFWSLLYKCEKATLCLSLSPPVSWSLPTAACELNSAKCFLLPTCSGCICFILSIQSQVDMTTTAFNRAGSLTQDKDAHVLPLEVFGLIFSSVWDCGCSQQDSKCKSYRNWAYPCISPPAEQPL